MGAMIELIRRFSGQAEIWSWILHTATFRVIFGDRYAGNSKIPKPKGRPYPLQRFNDASDTTFGINTPIHDVKGNSIETPNSRCPLYKCADEFSCNKLGLSEVRIMGFHVNSGAFKGRFSSPCLIDRSRNYGD